MKFYIAIIVLGYVANTMCLECKWTGCEGISYKGQGLCDQYGYGQYTGNVNKNGCSWDTEMVKCCKGTEQCEWTTHCYGVNYGAGYVCNREFGKTYKPGPNKKQCSGLGMTQYECCRR